VDVNDLFAHSRNRGSRRMDGGRLPP
jgi:hypothetical protein